MKPKSSNGRTSNVQGIRKRKQILNSAGRVFADKGYAGAGMREIAAACETPPSALIYHFGSKENLFLEALRFHIIENAHLENLFEPFDSASPDNPQSISDALLQSVSNLLRVCHGPTGRVSNLNGLIICMLTDSGMMINRMFQQFGDMAMGHVFVLLMQVNPQLSVTDIFWWSHQFWALIFYPITARLMLLSETRQRKYSAEFLSSMAWRIACQLCWQAGLPKPQRVDGADQWTIQPTTQLRDLMSQAGLD